MKNAVLSLALLMSAPVLCQEEAAQSTVSAEAPVQGAPVVTESPEQKLQEQSVEAPAPTLVQQQESVTDVIATEQPLSLLEFTRLLEMTLARLIDQLPDVVKEQKDPIVVASRIRIVVNAYVHQFMSMQDAIRAQQEAVLASLTSQKIQELFEAPYSPEEAALVASRDSAPATA